MKRLLFWVALANVGFIQAQDRLFTYTYQSTVLAKSHKEIEVWNTLRSGKSDYFSRLDHRTEYEVGLGKNLQTSFYLNLTTQTSGIQNNGSKSLVTENEISFSNEWKLKLLDPVANRMGLALYGEYGIGKEYELECKLILDKRINNFTFAANAVYELELEPEAEANEIEMEKENKTGLNLALAYSFTPRFALTFENTLNNIYEAGELEHSAIYSGLGCSFAQQDFWVNFTVMPQIESFKGQTGSLLNLNEFEKVQFRLLFSYVF